MELIDFFKENKFAGCENIYIRPHIPAKQLSNAVGAYSVRVEPKEVVVLIDDTAFGSGKDGILICENRLVIREMFSSARAYEYDAIESISCEARRLYINEREAYKLNIPGKDELGAFFEMMNQWISLRGASSQSRENRATAPASSRAGAGMGEFLFEVGRKVISDKVYVRPHIPAKKLQSAINAYGNGVSPEEVIILVDDTAFGSAKDGILITDKSIYIKIFTEALRAYEWEAVESIDIEKKTIYVNGAASGKLVQATEKDLGHFFDNIDEYISKKSTSSCIAQASSSSGLARADAAELTFDLDAVVPVEPSPAAKAIVEMEPQVCLVRPEQENNISVAQNEAMAIASIVEAEVSANHPVAAGEDQSVVSLQVAAKDSKAKDKLLTYISTAIEENKSKILPLIKEKTGEASLSALRDDSNVEKLAGFIYAFLPGLVRFALKEQVFVQFMLDNRNKILSGLLPPIDSEREAVESQEDRLLLDIESASQQSTKKLSAFARPSKIALAIKPSFYARSLGEFEQFIVEFTQEQNEASRSVQKSPDFQGYVRNYHLTRFCAETLSFSMKGLESISARLALSTDAERAAFKLDSVILVMLSYATASMSFLLHAEAGYDHDQSSELLAPIFEALIISYANDLLGDVTNKTLRGTVNPYERVLASETLKSYKMMLGLFSKNIERQDGESLSGHFEHFVVRASIEVFEKPDDRFKLSSKMASDEGRKVVLDVLVELDAQLESTLVQHLEDRSGW
ncbi:hypothetical protein RPW65_01345 [Pseudomonas sp. NyZ704]|nr:hypothetical protein RPW65_01345 [Pseudomonas sp. NyZ704]